jgi:hypothetical protein
LKGLLSLVKGPLPKVTTLKLYILLKTAVTYQKYFQTFLGKNYVLKPNKNKSHSSSSLDEGSSLSAPTLSWLTSVVGPSIHTGCSASSPGSTPWCLSNLSIRTTEIPPGIAKHPQEVQNHPQWRATVLEDSQMFSLVISLCWSHFH